MAPRSWVETVPKHGYRFTADVKAVAPAGETPAASVEVASFRRRLRCGPVGGEQRGSWQSALRR